MANLGVAIRGVGSGISDATSNYVNFAGQQQRQKNFEMQQNSPENQLKQAVSADALKQHQEDMQKVKREDLEKANPYVPYMIEAAKASGLIVGDEQEFTRGKIKETLQHFMSNPQILSSVVDKSYQNNLAKDKQYEIAIADEQKKLPELQANPIGNEKKIADIQKKISEYQKAREPFSQGRMRDSQAKDQIGMMVQAKFYQDLPKDDQLVYKSLVDQGIKMPTAQQIEQEKVKLASQKKEESQSDHYTIEKNGETKSVRLKPGESIPKGWKVVKTSDSGMQLTPEALQALADRYKATGDLPSMGMGKAATEARTKVLNQWASDLKRTGATPEDQLAKQAAYKASVGELKRLQGQRGTVLAFANTAEKNLELVDKISDKVNRSGVPVLNRWLLAGKRSVTGDPEVAKFDAATRTAINEYAKVTSSATGGAVTSDAARKEVESMLNTAQTADQVKAVIALLRKEMGNRKEGYDQQIKQITESISGKDSSNSPDSKDPLGLR